MVNCVTWLTAATLAIGVPAQTHAQVSGNAETAVATPKQEILAWELKPKKPQKQKDDAAARAKAKIGSKAGADPAIPVKSAVASQTIVTMPNNRPTVCSADNLNCIALTGRLHLDAGGYDYRPDTASTRPQQAQDGVNARRARLGVLGTLMGDWDYGLIFDFGGPQFGKVTVENAYLTYKGIKDLYVDGGYINVPYTLDQATSSNDIMFLERSSVQTVAKSIAAGNGRAAFGAHANSDWWWIGSYVTGPTSSVDPGPAPPLGATARGLIVPINNQYGSLLLGADAEFLIDTGAAAGPNTLSALRDRIEVRIDPGTNALLNTGAIANVSGARVISGEAAAQVGSFYAQGEYFDFWINRFSGLPDLHFNGGYAEASYVITGERRKYNPITGAYGGIKPAAPVDWTTNGWGAWEIAARYSHMKLNDLDILGGELKNITVGVNWYVNANVRLMFNWIHGSVAKNAAAPSGTDIGASYNVVAMRAQVAF